MKKVWLIQERVFAYGKYFESKIGDIEIYARKKSAIKALNHIKEFAVKSDYKVVAENEIFFCYTDEDGWTFSFRIFEKSVFL